MRKNVFMNVAELLTADERAAFLANAQKMVARIKGAEVADVLDMSSDNDLRLDITEPMHEEISGFLPAWQHYYITTICHALYFVHGGKKGWGSHDVLGFFDRFIQLPGIEGAV